MVLGKFLVLLFYFFSGKSKKICIHTQTNTNTHPNLHDHSFIWQFCQHPKKNRNLKLVTFKNINLYANDARKRCLCIFHSFSRHFFSILFLPNRPSLYFWVLMYCVCVCIKQPNNLTALTQCGVSVGVSYTITQNFCVWALLLRANGFSCVFKCVLCVHIGFNCTVLASSCACVPSLLFIFYICTGGGKIYQIETNLPASSSSSSSNRIDCF